MEIVDVANRTKRRDKSIQIVKNYTIRRLFESSWPSSLLLSVIYSLQVASLSLLGISQFLEGPGESFARILVSCFSFNVNFMYCEMIANFTILESLARLLRVNCPRKFSENSFDSRVKGEKIATPEAGSHPFGGRRGLSFFSLFFLFG